MLKFLPSRHSCSTLLKKFLKPSPVESSPDFVASDFRLLCWCRNDWLPLISLVCITGHTSTINRLPQPCTTNMQALHLSLTTLGKKGVMLKKLSIMSGLSVEQVLARAGWSSEDTFCKHYFRPPAETESAVEYGRAVLSCVILRTCRGHADQAGALRSTIHGCISLPWQLFLPQPRQMTAIAISIATTLSLSFPRFGTRLYIG